ncbi:MAG TPA: methionyl-tRNA formyltransferase [Thermoanaerobaculia bacterium]|nr:methionyl-tRNA formyltransferase [Thermoanaerobaculia bacterium]
MKLETWNLDGNTIAGVNVAFFGTPDFAVPALEALVRSRHRVVVVIAQPDRPAGRGMKLKRPPGAERALDLGLPLAQPERIRERSFLEWFGGLGVDAGVVVAYGRILPPDLIALPPHGLINLHGSLLPKYRGAAPIQRAIEQGDTVTGATIMRIDEQLDHGPILASHALGIDPDERTPSLAERMAREGAGLLVETLTSLEDGTIREIPQAHQEATFAGKIEKEEGRIDWTLPAKRIYDRFRAFWPWPGIFTEIRGESVKLIELSWSAGGTEEPGRILSFEGNRAAIATPEGVVMIERMQRPGKTPVDAAAFLRALDLGAGDSLR